LEKPPAPGVARLLFVDRCSLFDARWSMLTARLLDIEDVLRAVSSPSCNLQSASCLTGTERLVCPGQHHSDSIDALSEPDKLVRKPNLGTRTNQLSNEPISKPLTVSRAHGHREEEQDRNVEEDEDEDEPEPPTTLPRFVAPLLPPSLDPSESPARLVYPKAVSRQSVLSLPEAIITLLQQGRSKAYLTVPYALRFHPQLFVGLIACRYPLR
jgi:hypothetical protein